MTSKSFLKMMFSFKLLYPGKNIRLFQNPLLEKLTYVPPIVPLLLWVPVIVFLFMYEAFYTGELAFSTSALMAISGLLFWTFAEYILHRFVFHFEPRGRFQERISFLIHGIHHEDPQDARRLLMPPVAALAIAGVLYALYFQVLGAFLVKPFFSGFLVGYLIYDYTHFAVHFINPKSEFFKKLKQNHMLHHFVTEDRRYGVSTTFWDPIFGTDAEIKTSQKITH